jgi:hypothetical protein
VQDAIANTHPNMRAESFTGAIEENEIQSLPVGRDKGMFAVVPKVARTKVWNEPTEMAQHGVCESLAVCTSG